MLTWFAWGAATKIIGPLLGIFHEPRGCTSRKNRSTSTEKVHSRRSYIQLIMGNSSLGFDLPVNFLSRGTLELLAGIFWMLIEDYCGGCAKLEVLA